MKNKLKKSKLVRKDYFYLCFIFFGVVFLFIGTLSNSLKFQLDRVSLEEQIACLESLHVAKEQLVSFCKCRQQVMDYTFKSAGLSVISDTKRHLLNEQIKNSIKEKCAPILRIKLP